MKLEKIKEKIINDIKKHNDDKALVEAKLTIVNENHTMGNLITRVIQEHPDIEFCGYNVDHLYVNELTLRYKTNGKSIIDILETSQLQDFVPQKANAAELANGNVLLYSGITESYNKTNMNLVGNSFSDLDGYYFDY
jgi:DNA-directed RNA polymerase subunit L